MDLIERSVDMPDAQKQYKVEIKRVSFIEYTVEASTLEEAHEKAIDLAGQDYGDNATFTVEVSYQL